MRISLPLLAVHWLFFVSAECQSMPNGLGLPGAVSIKGGSSSPKQRPWIGMESALGFVKKQDIVPEEAEDDSKGLPISIFLLYPAVSLLTAPYLAPYSEKIFDMASSLVQKLLGVPLQLFTQIGILYKCFSVALAKNLDFVASSCRTASDGTVGFFQEVYQILKNLSDKMASKLRLVCDFTMSLIEKIRDSCSKLTYSASSTVANQSVAAWRMINGVASFARNSASLVSNAAIVCAKEVKAVCGLTISIIEQSLDSCCKFACSAVRNVVSQSVATWKMTSSFLVYISEQTLSNAASGIFGTLNLMVAISAFFANSIARCTETVCSSVCAVAKNTWKSFISLKEKGPVWLDGFVSFMPFLEKEEGRAALTRPAQAILYLASIGGSSHPALKIESSPQNRVGRAVSTAVETITWRVTSPRALFLTGALARGIQLSTTLAYAVQPSLGAGALINIGAVAANERWITVLMAGWFSTEKLWTLFGTRAPKINP